MQLTSISVIKNITNDRLSILLTFIINFQDFIYDELTKIFFLLCYAQ